MNIDLFKQLSPFQQEVILLLGRVVKALESIEKVGEE